MRKFLVALLIVAGLVAFAAPHAQATTVRPLRSEPTDFTAAGGAASVRSLAGYYTRYMTVDVATPSGRLMGNWQGYLNRYYVGYGWGRYYGPYELNGRWYVELSRGALR